MLRSIKIWVMTLTCLSLIVTMLPSPAVAQTNTENFAQFEFNFNNPGARATGIGGAFISIADDATAAEANPAGLTTLIRPEISFELKGVRYTQHVSNFTHEGTFLDFTVKDRNFDRSVISPSFASLVYPVKNLTFSAFRYELVNFESEFYTKGSFISTLPNTGSVALPVKASMDLRIVNWGGAASVKINEKFSLGASFGVSQIDANSSFSRFGLEVFDEATVVNNAAIDDTDNDLFFNVGFILKPVDKLSIGGLYKRRPEFSLGHTLTAPSTGFSETKDINFNAPSAFGLGLSYRPTDALIFSFDAVRVNYSELTDNFVVVFIPDFVKGDDYKVDNGMEFHFGAEYVSFIKSVGYVLRGGFFTEPDNRIRWVGQPANSSDPDQVEARRIQSFFFQEGDNDFHYTFGLGFILMKDFQIDLAGNLSRGSDEGVASVVLRF